MKSMLSASPAYGRDYKSKAELLKDWNEGKDFLGFSMIPPFSGYFSIRDTTPMKLDYSGIQFRYQKQTKVHIIKL